MQKSRGDLLNDKRGITRCGDGEERKM